MIRINLLGTAKPKKATKRFTMPQLTMEGPSPWMVALGLVVVACAGLYWYYHTLQGAHEKLQTQIAEANRSIIAMTKVKQAFAARQKEYDAYKRRFDTIDQLRASQSQVSPVELLKKVSKTVDDTEGVWLLNLKDEGEKVSMDGVALGPKQVANLMTNLRGSGYFKNVQLHEAAQEDTQKLQTFSFSLVCEKTKA